MSAGRDGGKMQLGWASWGYRSELSKPPPGKQHFPVALRASAGLADEYVMAHDHEGAEVVWALDGRVGTAESFDLYFFTDEILN